MAMAKRSSSIPTYKRRRKGRRGFIGWLWRIILALFLFSILWVVAYRFIPPPITATMIGDLAAGRGLSKDWMSLDEMDRDMVRAAIAAEDGKFCQHSGFDWDAISDAARRNASGGRIRGGSTISQQTAKNVFLWQGGGYLRKGVEAYFTFLIEQLWGKRRIMEVYLNVAETGIGTYGANAGAQRYFGHDADALSATEAARIAAILPLPKKRGAIAPKGFARRYGNTISARIGQVRRDGLDACVYQGTTAPKDKAPPPSKAPRELPGDEYETATPPPPEASVDTTPVEEPAVATEPTAIEETPSLVPSEPAATPPAVGNDVSTSMTPPTEPQN
jgi:monofunctional biosynthetic peptidoglycan transglycosylase